HTRLRRLVSKVFTSARVETMRPRIEAIADGLLQRIEPGQVSDIVGTYAVPLPVMVIGQLLGIPPEDEQKFSDCANMILGAIPADDMRELNDSITEYMGRLVAEKRAKPGDDLIGALVAARDDADMLSEIELTSMIFLLVIAGHETTAKLIGNSIL